MPLSIYQILLKTESMDVKFQTSIHQKGGVGVWERVSECVWEYVCMGVCVCVCVCGSVCVSQHHHEWTCSENRPSGINTEGSLKW